MTTNPAPRWLDEEEQQVWRDFLTSRNLLSMLLERELSRDQGVSHAYYEVLVHLSEAPDQRLRMGQLARLTNSSRSRLSHAVKRLADMGWVSREAALDDQRGALAILTAEGQRVLEKAAPVHVTGVRTHLFDQLSEEEVKTLGVISAKLVTHLSSIPMLDHSVEH
jgi:DNA-binding MarR family transcriptional regulator